MSSIKKIPQEGVFYFLLFVHLIFVLLNFDPKMHIGGDDSDYIVAAYKFLHGEEFPSWHGSFYPIFLSFFMWIGGIEPVLFKLISLLLSLLHFYFFYQAFKDKVPQAVLFLTLIAISFSYHLTYYGSTTYSEPLFLFLQALVFYFLSKIENQEGFSRQSILLCVALALSMFLVAITRNIGIGIIGILVLYFLLTKRFKYAGAITVGFVFFYSVFLIYKSLYWGADDVGIEGQLSRIAYKNFYNPAAGTEDVAGFVRRFWDNSNLYLSKHLAVMFGLRAISTTQVMPFITVLFYGLYLFSLYQSFKKNRFLFLTTLYIGAMTAVTFITQQTHWDQPRLIMVYFPLIAITFWWAVYSVLNISKNTFGKNVFYGAALVFVLLIFIQSLIAEKNIGTTLTNITSKKKKFEGYPTEWKNYIELSEWVGENIDQKSRILCRKPGISFVYGKRAFDGLYRFPHREPDSAVSIIERKEISYVILDNLRMPTVQTMLSFYLQKRPLGLEVVKVMGSSSPSYLLKINENDPATDNEFLNRAVAGMYVAPKSSYYYVLAANRFLNNHEYKKAADFYSKGISVEPSNYDILVQRGLAYAYMNDLNKAISDISTAIQKNPENKEYQIVLEQVTRMGTQRNGQSNSK